MQNTVSSYKLQALQRSEIANYVTLNAHPVMKPFGTSGNYTTVILRPNSFPDVNHLTEIPNFVEITTKQTLTD